MFPSPIGELHFSMNLAAEVKKLREEVSVPYRGATFLNVVFESGNCQTIKPFPSPIGELHFSISDGSSIPVGVWFPSPIGELHFSMVESKDIDIVLGFVSVPYRGATFLNNGGKKMRISYKVSVPYRGATFLNKEKTYGVHMSKGFRPLSGSYISQYGGVNVCTFFNPVSVPYRGATFLNDL